MDQEYWQSEFEKAGNLLQTWLMVAHDLMEADKILMGRFRAAEIEAQNTLTFHDESPKGLRVRSPALLLRAAAFEALFKGLAVRRGHRFVVNGKFKLLENTGKGHDLVLLAKATSFSLSHNETLLLEQLSSFLELGRYPIGRRWDVGLTDDPEIGLIRADEFDEISDGECDRLLVRLHDAVTGKDQPTEGQP